MCQLLCILWFDLYRPRITTERGNLVFLTVSARNIEFRTGSLGKIKLNDEDLGECLHQVYIEVILCIYKWSLN